jgi:sRNA-binding carbon storage regulator CsrA
MTDLTHGETIVLDAFGETIATIRIVDSGRSFARIGIKARKNVRIRRD